MTEIAVSQHLTGDVLTLTLRETRLDAARALAFKEDMRRRIDGHDGRVILDLAEVTFLDSSGLGALVAVMKMLGDGRRLELVHCGSMVRKVLHLTHMDRVFVLHGAEDAPNGRNAA